MFGYANPVFFVFLIALVPCAIGGVMAANRGRNVLAWCLLSALFPPLLLFIFFARPLCAVEGKYRKCCKCGNLIKWREPVCSYCQSEQAESV